MNRVFELIVLCFFFHLSFCLKFCNISNKAHLDKYFFLNSSGILARRRNNVNKQRTYQRTFYRNKKERDILESGYLYPFDHLEKKKKQFPPDPFSSLEEEREEAETKKAIDIFDEELNSNIFFNYDDNDAKQYFGKTEFNRPERIVEDNEEIGEDNIEKEKNCESERIEKNKTSDRHNIYNIEETITNTSTESNRNNSLVTLKKNNEDAKIIQEKEGSHKRERELVKISVYFSEGNHIKGEIMKDQLHYLFHSCMDNTFNETYHLDIGAYSNKTGEDYEIRVLYSNDKNVPVAKKVIKSFSDLIDFYRKVKSILNNKIEMLHKKKMENLIYLNKNERKELEKYKKEKKVLDKSKKNLQISVESSLRLIEKCITNMYKQKFEITVQDLKLAYTMLPCKYYGYFLANVCAHISILSFYINDLQTAFDFALEAIKYEPRYCLSWKCLGDSYRSFRKFWQAKNAYDIAIYLGYTDTKGENFKEIMKALNTLTKKALENVAMLKENMNNHLHVTVKKNIGIVINKNPDCIGGCYVSYIIEGSKAGKKSFQHGDQIVSLNNIITLGKPIDFCLKAFQKNEGLYDLIFFKGNIIELYGLKAYKYLMENNLFSLLFEDENISSFKKSETILFDMRGFGTFSEYSVSRREV